MTVRRRAAEVPQELEAAAATRLESRRLVLLDGWGTAFTAAVGVSIAPQRGRLAGQRNRRPVTNRVYFCGVAGWGAALEATMSWCYVSGSGSRRQDSSLAAAVDNKVGPYLLRGKAGAAALVGDNNRATHDRGTHHRHHRSPRAALIALPIR